MLNAELSIVEAKASRHHLISQVQISEFVQHYHLCFTETRECLRAWNHARRHTVTSCTGIVILVWDTGIQYATLTPSVHANAETCKVQDRTRKGTQLHCYTWKYVNTKRKETGNVNVCRWTPLTFKALWFSWNGSDTKRFKHNTQISLPFR